MKNTLTTLSVLSFSLSVLAADPVVNYKLLQNRRLEMALPDYTLDNKKDVVDQAKLILNEMFVHRAIKLENFGTQIDPLPMLANLEQNMEGLSTAAFHGKMRQIFQAQRDLHTSYQLSFPYLCYRSLIPVEFKEVIGVDGQKVIAVKNVLASEEITKILPDTSILDRIQIGDVLLEYGGKDINDVMSELMVDSAGANPDADRREAVSLIGFVSQKQKVAPTADSIILKLKSRFGKIYTVTVPWLSKENETCLKPSKALPLMPKHNVAENEIRNEINDIFRSPVKVSSNKINETGPGWKTTGESILRYKTINNEYGRFGVFDFDSFSPTTLGIDELIQVFKNVLETEFAKTDGIIIDLRDNGGGYISLAEGLVELFNAQNTQPAGFRMRATPAVSHYVNGTMPATNEFRMSLSEAVARGSYYTEPKQIDVTATMNKRGQSYFRPVAILNNANCYSSCDLFSALMQDHGAAVVFGEDRNTGAGGANNVQLTDVLKQLGAENPGPFEKLPFGQNIGFAFRQMIRVGLHAGELIEDIGVISDVVVEPKISDLYTESADQFKVISKKLNQMSSQYSSSVKFKSESRQDLVRNMTPTLFASWEQTSDFVFKSNGQIIDQESVELDNLQGREVKVGSGLETSKIALGELEVLGMLDGRRVWRKNVSYRVVPETLPLPTEGVSAESLTIYTTKPEAGWIVSHGKMRVGRGTHYDDGVHTEGSLFVLLPAEAKKLSFEAALKTEKDFDFFEVLAIVDGKEKSLTGKLSGAVALKTYEVDLSAYAGKKIEIRFVFDADEGVNDEGPVVGNLKIQ